ncbi:MAG: deoxyribonuclease IV [Anaerolineales bacterium]|nr:MAG: deoxyribonuclease IV [Anaerolineales bacterium]
MTGPRLGAHMSIAGGPANALLRGHSIGCDAVQIFTRNANRWRSKELTSQQIKDFQQARAATGIHPIVAHSSYLINMATPDDDLWRRSVEALILEMRRCQQLGVRDYVLHPGAHRGSGEEAGLERIAAALSAALSATAGAEVRVLLENTAGQGSGLGYTFEHLAWLMAHTEGTERLGVCFDTAHALAAGYEFRQAESYAAMWEHFCDIIGLERLHAIHLNDSKRDLASRVDRHEHIGKGYVGLEAFRMLVNDPRLRSVPMLLETPKGPDMLEDVENLALLRDLIHD